MRKPNPIAIFAISLTAIALLAAGCQSKPNTLERPTEDSNQNSETAPDDTSFNNDHGQVAGQIVKLPTQKITVANQELNVEVATTNDEKAQGLSDRADLEEGNGMLFDFSAPGDMKKPGFWMKDMLISIDIIWINNGKIVGIQANAPLPPEDADLPVYYPPSEITHVLEVPAGWAKKNNIVIGESVSL